MTVIYLIRHGQTDWNVAKRLQGHTDTEMTARGRGQARRNGRMLAHHIVNPECFQFISSPLKRARHTMEILRRELGLPDKGFDLDDRLKEINYGDWQGESWATLLEKDPDAVQARFTDPWCEGAPGGESYHDLSERVLSWFTGLTRNAIVTAHGGIIRVLRGYLEDLPKLEIPVLDVPQHKIMVIEGGQISWI